MKDNKMKIDTPRTDAALVDHMPSCSEWSQHYLDLSTLARQLERELAASQAEVDRLKHLLSDLLILTEKNYWNSSNYSQIKEAINPTDK
jgi:sulfur transfer protein SufE